MAVSSNQLWRRPYSFSDISLTISHPAYGAYDIGGDGIGSITFTDPADKTAHDIAATGQTMVSKMNNFTGQVAISVQQISDLDKYLLGLYNYLVDAPTDEWALITLYFRAPKMGETITLKGFSFQNRATRGYAAQGQQHVWTLWAADMRQLPI